MIPDKVIVTIQNKQGQVLGDYELPAKLPADSLGEKLSTALSQSGVPGLAGKALTLSVGGKRLLPGETLAQRGVWDGSILTLEP